MKVLYSFPHTLGNSGIGTAAVNQVRGLAEAGHNVRVYTTATSVALPANVEVVRTMTVFGRRVRHRAIGVKRAYRYHDSVVARAVRTRRADFDVLHVWPGSCLRSIAAARRVGLPSFRESPSPHTADAFVAAASAAAAHGLTVPARHSHHPDPVRLAAEEAEYAAADFILAPSDHVIRSYLAHGIAADRLLRHRYGFDEAAFPLPGPREKHRPFTAIFLGSIEPFKGLHLALSAWIDAGLAGRGRFLVAGPTDSEYVRVIRPLLTAARAEMLGFVAAPGHLLSTSDIMVLPSASEGSALVTYEAMASGAVPLVSDVTGAPVIDGRDGLIHSFGDVGQLTRQIANLDRDRECLAQLRTNALARRQELNWSAAATALVDAYRVGLDRHSSSSSLAR